MNQLINSEALDIADNSGNLLCGMLNGEMLGFISGEKV